MRLTHLENLKGAFPRINSFGLLEVFHIRASKLEKANEQLKNEMLLAK